MKTITEFAGSTLQNALKTKQELLAAGKTAEELPAALGEALKLEGEKLTLLLSALEVVEKKSQDLKRVVVWSLQEGEKPPRGTEQKGEHHFGIEYFPPMPGQKQARHGKGRGDRDRDRKGGRKGRKGRRDGRGPRRDDRKPGEGAPLSTGSQEKKPAGEGENAEKKRRRRRWKPRGPKPEQVATSGKIIPKPKSPAASNSSEAASGAPSGTSQSAPTTSGQEGEQKS